jgi:pilus assembly protein CpaC
MSKGKKFCIFSVVSMLACAAFLSFSEGSDDGVIRIVVNDTKLIPVSMPTRVAIGNPAVADVASVSTSEIAISGKAPGKTTLVYWDNFGEQSAEVKVLSEDVIENKRKVDSLLGNLGLVEVYTRPDEDSGKVLILGRVRLAKDKERLLLALGGLKDKIIDLSEVKEEQSVVEIDVQVLELNKDATNTLGISWPGQLGLVETDLSPAMTAAGAKWSTLFKVLTGNRGIYSTEDNSVTVQPFHVKLDALVQEGKARILSRPRLACQSGKEAQLLVGGEKPTFTTSTTEGGSTSSTIEYKEYGIKLKMNPVVSEDNRIKLNLSVEVSDVGDAETIGDPNAPTAKAYPLTKRTASTELFLNDGQTMAIGGLIKQKSEEDLRKFPWLSDVPVLGMFFRQRITKTGGGTGTRGDTELFITLTPTVVSKDIARPTPDMKKEVAQKVRTRLPEPVLAPKVANYAKAVQTKIVRQASYPASAKEAGWEGVVRLGLKLAANGDLLGLKVNQSSGYKVLDEAALSVARSLAPYPPFPPQIDAPELTVEVPIVYQSN